MPLYFFFCFFFFLLLLLFPCRLHLFSFFSFFSFFFFSAFVLVVVAVHDTKTRLLWVNRLLQLHRMFGGLRRGR